MKAKYFKRILVAVLAVSFFVTGCSSAETTSLPTSSAAPPAPPSSPAAVSVDESFNGKEVRIAVGGSLQVELASNPTTGFKWELTGISDPAVLEKVSDIFQAPTAKQAEGEPPMVGAGGKEFWHFKALKAGKSVIEMGYSRPWEGGEKGVQKFSLTVIVE